MACQWRLSNVSYYQLMQHIPHEHHLLSVARCPSSSHLPLKSSVWQIYQASKNYNNKSRYSAIPTLQFPNHLDQPNLASRESGGFRGVDWPRPPRGSCSINMFGIAQPLSEVCTLTSALLVIFSNVRLWPTKLYLLNSFMIILTYIATDYCQYPGCLSCGSEAHIGPLTEIAGITRE